VDLDLAGRAFDWIASVAVGVDGGLGWLEDGALFDDLYSGTAGVLLGCAEAAAAGLDTARVSAGARGRLAHLARQDAGTMPDDGLFSGWAGIAVALGLPATQALRPGDSGAVTRAAHVLASRLAEAAEPGPGGLHWRMVADGEYLMPGFSHGTAGVAYALAAAGRTLHRRDLADAAIRGAEAVLAARCPSGPAARR
jgi:hypothetical protein